MPIPTTDRTQPPVDAIPVNGWVLILEPLASERRLNSPHFHKLEGLSRKTGKLEVVDGGTNVKYHFSDGIMEAGDINIKRTRDGSPDDATFDSYINAVFTSGRKRNGRMEQYRFGRHVLTVRFTGLLLHEFELANFDTHGSDKSDQTYKCTCDWWECVFPA
jgi:hypothetical protein